MKPYYGIKPVPRGRERASMMQAIERKQVRYWGLRPVDPLIIRDNIFAKELEDKIVKLQDARRKLNIFIRPRFNKMKEHVKFKEMDKAKKLREKLLPLNDRLKQIDSQIAILKQRKIDMKDNKKLHREKTQNIIDDTDVLLERTRRDMVI